MERLNRFARWIVGAKASRGLDASASPSAGAQAALGPYRTSVSRGEIAVLYTGRQLLGGLAASASWVYLADGPILYRLAPEGGAPDMLARFENPAEFLAIGADHLYIGGSRSVRRAPAQGSGRESTAPRRSMDRSSATSEATMTRVEEEREIESADDKLIEQHHSWVIAAPLGAAKPTTLAYRPHKIDGLFVDGEAVHWVERRTDGTNVLMSVPPSGGTPAELMTLLRSDGSWRFAAAMDARHVYWTDAAANRILAAPRHDSAHYRLAELGAMPLALTAEGGALYALAGDPTKPRREVFQISPRNGTMNLFAHFDAERRPNGGGYAEGRLAASAAGLFAHDGTRLLALGQVPTFASL